MGEKNDHRGGRRYPPELKERALRLVDQAAAEDERHGAVTRVAKQLGIGPESLRQWVRQARIDRGELGGLTSAERERVREFDRRLALPRSGSMQSFVLRACRIEHVS
jgi:transposase